MQRVLVLIAACLHPLEVEKTAAPAASNGLLLRLLTLFALQGCLLIKPEEGDKIPVREAARRSAVAGARGEDDAGKWLSEKGGGGLARHLGKRSESRCSAVPDTMSPGSSLRSMLPTADITAPQLTWSQQSAKVRFFRNRQPASKHVGRGTDGERRMQTCAGHIFT